MQDFRVPSHRLALLTMWLLTLTGCSGKRCASAPQTVARNPDAALRSTPTSIGFGDDAPFGIWTDPRIDARETRLLTNVTRHTFTSLGRDFDPDIAPDGRTLVFASTRNADHPDLFLKQVDGYAVTQLTSDPADDIQPRFSPDGQRIVFSSNRAGNWDIWMINRDGTGLTQLTDQPADEIAPCFSPDGRQVAFTVFGPRSRRWELWVLSVDSPGVRRFLAYGMFPDFSPDGKRIAFQRARQRGSHWFSIWTVDLVDGDARHPTEIVYSDAAACVAPRFSRDGQALVFCTVIPPEGADRRARPAAEIWVVNIETGIRRKLTDGAVPAFNPTWSPDGRIYYVSSRAEVENIWSLAARLEPAPTGRATARLTPRRAATSRLPVVVNAPARADGKP